ncbi:hypothetical protein [Pedobacter agri]|uniref:hypothetical protein n=1 Tax=Pedobacter agri TaxID=454586 RepID=UPI00292CE7A0|nr:hypothetical protein [Pedobacter agri]
MKLLQYLSITFISFYSLSSAAQVEQDGPYVSRSGTKIISRYILNDVSKIDTLNVANFAECLYR